MGIYAGLLPIVLSHCAGLVPEIPSSNYVDRSRDCR